MFAIGGGTFVHSWVGVQVEGRLRLRLRAREACRRRVEGRTCAEKKQNARRSSVPLHELDKESLT